MSRIPTNTRARLFSPPLRKLYVRIYVEVGQFLRAHNGLFGPALASAAAGGG